MINGSAKTVWEVLSDLTLLATYDPTVQSATVLSPESKGVGAIRDLVLANGDHVVESVTTFEPRKRLELRAEALPMTVRTLERSYAMDDEGSRTRVTVVVEYEPKFGPLGLLLEKLWLRQRWMDVTHAGLYALKRYVEVAKR